MTRYLPLRLLFALAALWLVATMVFLLAPTVAGDPVLQKLGEGATREDLHQLGHSLRLDLPALVRATIAVAGAFQSSR